MRTLVIMFLFFPFIANACNQEDGIFAYVQNPLGKQPNLSVPAQKLDRYYIGLPKIAGGAGRLPHAGSRSGNERRPAVCGLDEFKKGANRPGGKGL